MAEVQRRATSGGDLGTRERRKSGIFFFNRSFKNSRSSSYSKGDADSPGSSPTTPTLSATKDYELKRSPSGSSIPALPQTSSISADADGVLTSSPKSTSNPQGDEAAPKGTEAISTEDLPTPPQTPGHSSVDAAAAVAESQAEEATVPEEPEVPAVKKVSYHDDADVHVTVRESDGVEAIYSVRAGVLETASTVWKQMLSASSSSSSSSSSPTTTLDLLADPSSGLDIIFSIAHYKFQSLPQQISEAELHDLALVADKYQTLHLLPPFLPSWLASSSVDSITTTTPLTGEAAEKLLVTAYILGHAQWFSLALAPAAHASSLAPDGTTLLTTAGTPWSTTPVSPAVIALLTTTRAASIERILHAVTTPMHRLLNPERYPDEDTRYCLAGADVDEAVREECEQLQLGSAIMGLTKARLWPTPEPASRIRVSPVELAQAYREVRMRRYQTPGLRFQEGDVTDVHAQCGLGHLGAIDAILSESTALDAATVEDLVARAKKAGVYSEALFAGFESVVGGGQEAAAAAAAVVVEEEEEATPTTEQVEAEQPVATEETVA